ncbi:nucleoside triphosphate hydrolase [soil metagenome]
MIRRDPSTSPGSALAGEAPLPTLDENADWLAAILKARYRGTRIIAGIAGPPGSGKSTLAEITVDRLNAAEPGIAAVLPMDGFHYDDSVLRDLGRFPRKGAIDTFDAGGFVHMVRRLKANAEDTIAVPVFDRSIEIARAGGRLIPLTTGIIVVEGNYLLIQRPPWTELRDLLDVTAFLATGVDTLRERLTKRWVDIGLTSEGIDRKLREVDLPNGLFILEESAAADHRIVN